MDSIERRGRVRTFLLGSAVGASAAIAAISTVRSIATGVLPPIANYANKDPACDLDFVAGKARETPVGLALVNAFGFGGHCVSVAFSRV